MKNIKWASFTQTFKEKMYDEEGNLIVDKTTGKPKYKSVARVVRHNAMYIPYKH